MVSMSLNAFDEGATVAPGDVYVVCHPSSDAAILEATMRLINT